MFNVWSIHHIFYSSGYDIPEDTIIMLFYSSGYDIPEDTNNVYFILHFQLMTYQRTL